MVLIASGMALSVAAGAKSADQVTGQYQYIGKGNLKLIAKGSATGMLYTLMCNGVAVANDQNVINFGTTGTMTAVDNVCVEQLVVGGRVELYFRNPTGGALTVDYQLFYEPTR